MPETQSGSFPVSFTPKIFGQGRWNGWPAMARATSSPPAPMASIDNPGRRRGMGVGAEHGLARHAETLQVHLVGDAVARLGEVDAERAPAVMQEDMVVGILVVGLQQVVVDVLGRQLHLDPRRPPWP